MDENKYSLQFYLDMMMKESTLYESISDEITCIICFERMVSPKSLKCLHVFCISCIQRGIGKNGKIRCPTCRKVTKVKHKDPKWLPTAFLINKISDILFSHEKMLQQKTETYIDKVKLSIEKSMKNIASEADEKPSDTSKTNTQLKVVVTTDKNEKGSKKLTDDGLVQVYHDRKYSLQSTQKKVGEEEKTRRHTHQSLTCEGLHTGEQNVVPRNDNTVSICSKDKHVFRVEGQKQDYTINEDIKLKFLKFCSDGARCNAWSDNIHAFLTDRKGRVDTFNVFKVSDGGWLLSCKAKCEGPLTATVKANEKPITSFDIDVYSIFTDPIEV